MMNIQAQVKPLFRLITLTRTSLFITNIITEGGGGGVGRYINKNLFYPYIIIYLFS
jgi:hypothetical protein